MGMYQVKDIQILYSILGWIAVVEAFWNNNMVIYNLIVCTIELWPHCLLLVNFLVVVINE